MTDAEFLFRSHSQETKRTARGIYSKKGGSKSKSCRLPSDNLTKAQKKKLNGRIVTVNMNEKMSWSEFKTIAPDLQKEYITKLRTVYRARNQDIADMFGIDRCHFSKYINARLPDLKIVGSQHKGIAPEWEKFLSNEMDVGETLAIVVEEPKSEIVVEETPVVESKPVATKPKCDVVSGTLRFVGTPGIIFTKAMQILGDNDYELTIIFEEVCNDNSNA